MRKKEINMNVYLCVYNCIRINVYARMRYENKCVFNKVILSSQNRVPSIFVVHTLRPAFKTGGDYLRERGAGTISKSVVDGRLDPCKARG